MLTTLDTIAYLEAHAAEVLASEPRPGHRLAPRSEFRVDYEPLGVVGIIAPWNYPLQLAMLPLVTALLRNAGPPPGMNFRVMRMP